MAQWASIIGSPLVFLANLSLVYALVPLACRTQHSAPLHAANALSLAFTLVAAALAWHALRRSAVGAATQGKERQTLFLSQLGIAVSAMCALAILLQWIAQWFVAPCFA